MHARTHTRTHTYTISSTGRVRILSSIYFQEISRCSQGQRASMFSGQDSIKLERLTVRIRRAKSEM